MIEVVPFIQTLGTEKFKEFLIQPFTINMLATIPHHVPIPILFEGWRGKDMSNWYKFTNEEKYILEFYPTHYIITREVKVGWDALKYQKPIPRDIDDFINDMNRLNIKLYWTDWVDQNFEPKDFCEKDKIKDYYVDLLGKIDKSFELL